MQILKELSVEEAPIHIFCRLLRRDTFKVHNYMLLPPFMAYMFTFVMIIFLQRVDVNLSQSSYVAQSVRSHTLHDSRFNECQSTEDWFDWFELALRTMADEVDDTTAYPSRLQPVDLLMVRQLRTSVGECSLSDVMDKATKRGIGERCSRLFDSAEIPEDFGVDGRFMPNVRKREKDIPTTDGVKKLGYFYDFNHPENEFVELFYFVDNKTVLLHQLEGLKKAGFVDELTRALVVDVFSYFPDEERYILSSFTYESSRSGLVNSNAGGYVMMGFDMQTHLKRFIFSLDIGLFLSTLFLFGSFGHEVYQNRILNGSWLSAIHVWELFTLMMACLMFAVSVKRFQLYDLDWGQMRDDDPKKSARHFASVYIEAHNLYTDTFDLMCFAFLFLGFKLFYFVQYVSGLNIITATLRECVDDLIGLGIFALTLLSVYATAGVVVFGQVFEPMRTVWHSVSYLIRAAISAELEEYTIFHSFQPVITYVYFGSFFIFFWIMVLNLVLGVTSAAFLDAARSADHDSPVEVFFVFFLLRGPIFEIDRHTHNKIETHDMSCCVRAASQALKLRGSFFSRYVFLHSLRRTKRQAYVVLREELSLHREVTTASITRQELAELLPFMDPNSRNALFSEALAEAGRNTTTISIAEKRHNRLMAELSTINKLALHFEQNLNMFRSKLKEDNKIGSMKIRHPDERDFYAHEERPISSLASMRERRKSVHIDGEDVQEAESESSSFSDESEAEVIIPADTEEVPEQSTSKSLSFCLKSEAPKRSDPALPLFSNDSIAAVINRMPSSDDEDVYSESSDSGVVVHVASKPMPRIASPRRTREEMKAVSRQLSVFDDDTVGPAATSIPVLDRKPPRPPTRPPEYDML